MPALSARSAAVTVQTDGPFASPASGALKHPFGAVYAHDDCTFPIKCDLCGGDPECVKQCPKSALLLLPEYSLGGSNRLNNVLSYTQMKEIEYSYQGETKTIRYAEIGKEEL